MRAISDLEMRVMMKRQTHLTIRAAYQGDISSFFVDLGKVDSTVALIHLQEISQTGYQQIWQDCISLGNEDHDEMQ